MITDKIIEQEMKAQEIMMTIMENTMNQETLNGDAATEGSVAQLMQRNTTIQNNITMANNSIMTQTTTVEGQETDNTTNQATLDTLRMMIDMTAAPTDFFAINSQAITFDNFVMGRAPIADT